MPSSDLTDDEYRRLVLAARQRSPEEKILAGLKLFEEECELARALLRHENPNLTEAEIEDRLRDRIEERRKHEEVGIYASSVEDAISLIARRYQASGHAADRDLLNALRVGSRVMQEPDS